MSLDELQESLEDGQKLSDALSDSLDGIPDLWGGDRNLEEDAPRLFEDPC